MENKLTILGIVFLGPAMSGAIFVVTDMAFELLVASIVSAVMIIAFVGLWFVLPLSHGFRRASRENHNRSGP